MISLKMNEVIPKLLFREVLPVVMLKAKSMLVGLLEILRQPITEKLRLKIVMLQAM